MYDDAWRYPSLTITHSIIPPQDPESVVIGEK